MEGAIKTQNLLKVTEVELIYRSKIKASERPQISSSEDSYSIFIQNWDHDKIELLEQFKVLFLNRRNKVLGLYEVSSGGVTETVVDPKLIFSAALKAAACNIIVAHCHPSGDVLPSLADKKLTNKLKQAGQLLEIYLLDHIILTKNGYYSFADSGEL
jgi:DNA repair protein RadC